MATFVSDSFTDTNGTLLQNHTGEIGATWAMYPGYTGDAAIDTNVLYGAGVNVYDGYYASGISDSADYKVKATLIFKTSVSGAYWSIIGRADHTVSAGQDTYYYWDYATDNGAWTLNKAVAGVFTQLGTFTQADGADHDAELWMFSTTIQGLVDGTSQVSVTDSAITAVGRVGLFIKNVTGSPSVDYSMDTFSAVSPSSPPQSGGIFSPFQLWMDEELL